MVSRSIEGPFVITHDFKHHYRCYRISLNLALPKVLNVPLKRLMHCLRYKFLPYLLQTIQREISKKKLKDLIIESEDVLSEIDNDLINELQESKNSDDGVDDEIDTDSESESETDEEHSENERKISTEDESTDIMMSALDMDSDINRTSKMKQNTNKEHIYEENAGIERELKEHGFSCLRSLKILINIPQIICSLEVKLPLKARPILLESIIDKICDEIAFVRRIPNVTAVHIEYDKRGHPRTGSNWKIIISGFNRNVLKLVEKWCDLQTFETNHISAICDLYGIEAARSTIINELASVLNAYGLSVSYRHLSLIADKMTFFGYISPMTRGSMKNNTSPFLRITFEMAQKFIVDACLHKDMDNITSPSSAVILGQVGKFGTGLFGVKQDLTETLALHQRMKQQTNEIKLEKQNMDSYYDD